MTNNNTSLKYFHLRTPALPINKLLSCYSNGTNFLEDTQFLESLLIASESLYKSLLKEDSEKTYVSALKYFIRAASRSTPFGNYSGTSIGEFGRKDSIVLSNNNSSFYSLDNQVFFELINKLVLGKHEYWKYLVWYSNSSYYIVNDQIRYYEYYVKDKLREHKLSTIPHEPLIIEVLEFCNDGKSYEDICQLIMSFDFSFEESDDFLKELISNQVLFSELELSSLGNYQTNAINVLKRKLNFNSNNCELVEIQNIVNSLSHADFSKKINILNHLSTKLNPFLRKSEKPFKVDLKKETLVCELRSSIVNEIEECLPVLMSFTTPDTNNELNDFYKAFIERYEDAEVPLVEVIDSEMGIGYPVRSHAQADITPLLQGLRVPSEEGKTDPPKDTLSVNSNQLQLLNYILKEQNLKVLQLENIPFKEKQLKLSKSYAALCSVLSEGMIHLKSIGGSSGINLMSRFSINENELKTKLDKTLDLEDELYAPTILAEIDHVPQSRITNILNRDCLRKFTIPILIPGFKGKNSIFLRDLTIRIKNGKFVLYSKLHQRVVAPKLSSAHNFRLNPLPIYKLLCDLQHDDENFGMGWNWGALNHLTYLPRIQFKKIVLKRARWLVRGEADLKSPKSLDDFIAAFKEFKVLNKVPKYFFLIDGDNEILLDSENVWCCRILFAHISKKNNATLEEDLFNKDNLVVQDSSGNGYYNEIVVPLAKESNSPIHNFKMGTVYNVDSLIKTVGSEWLFIKVYSGMLTADRLLIDEIAPLVRKLVDQVKIEKFFFIRFADPHRHLRLRFKVSSPEIIGEIINLIHLSLKKYVDQRLVSKIHIDQYFRELDRYGIDNIDNSESLFHFNSLYAFNVIQLSKSEKDRWLSALLCTNQYLEIFELTEEEKISFTKTQSLNYQKEFNANSSEVRKIFNRKFKENQAAIEMILSKPNEYSVHLDEHKKEVSICYIKITNLIKEEKLKVDIFDLLASYIHMAIIRIIRSKQRPYEMLIYDFLNHYYLMKRHKEKVISN